MTTESPRAQTRRRYRLETAARQECDGVLKALRRHYPQLKGLSVRLEDRPDNVLVKAGLPAEAFSTYSEPDVLLFLHNIHQHGHDVADFRAAVRRVLLREIGALVGEDLDGEE